MGMTTQPAEHETLVVRDPIQLAASIPYLLGFVPDSSIVLTFVGGRGVHLLTVRLDLPASTADSRSFAAAFDLICARALRDDAHSLSAFIYPPTDDATVDIDDVISMVIEACERGRLTLLNVHSVNQGVCHDELDRNAVGVVLADTGLSTAAEWVARGVSYQGSREELSSWVHGSDGSYPIEVRGYIDRQEPEWDCSITRNRAARRSIEDDIVGYIERFGSQSATPDFAPAALPRVATLASWVVALSDSRVREPVLWRLAESTRVGDGSGQSRRMLDVMCLLLRSTPRRDAASLASCVAAFAWQCGNGAVADIAANHGLAADPQNVLCRLVSEAVGAGVHPSVWVEMLRAMTLDELRSGPRRRRHNGSADVSIGGVQVRDCPG